jgi:hypothetical protein
MTEAAPSAAAALAGEAPEAPVESAPQDNAIPTETPEPSFIDSFEGEVKGFVENKGWKSADDIINSYKHLESMRGVPEDKLLKLVGPEDAEGMAEIYNKLGRPETGDGYDFGDWSPSEDTVDISGWFKETAHGIGLSQHQAKALFEAYNSHVDGLNEQMADQSIADFEKNAANELHELKQQWGDDYNKNIATAQNAARKFDMDADTLGKIEQSLGTKGTMEFFAKIGKGLGEDQFTNSDSSGGFGMSPEMASAKLTELHSDKDFSARLFNGDKAAIAERDRLLRIKVGQSG